MSRVSKLFLSDEPVQKARSREARSRVADPVAARAIQRGLKRIVTLDSLKNSLTEELRNSVRFLDLTSRVITRLQLQTLIRLFPQVTALKLNWVSRTGMLDLITGFNALQRLELRYCQLIDEDITHLARLTQLQELDLSGNFSLTGHTFDQLSEALIWFNCAQCDLKRENMGHLARFKRLRFLVLDGYTDHQGDGNELNLLPLSIEELYFRKSNLMNANIEQFARLTNLLVLDLSGNELIERRKAEEAVHCKVLF